MNSWPFGHLRPLGYRVILMDPPWRFFNWSAAGEKKNPNQHYACMTLDELRALPVLDLAAGDCVVIMWATSPLLDEAIALLKHYGYAFKGAGAWGKRSKLDRGWNLGPGYIYRSTAEFWIIGTIGKPRRLSRAIRNLIIAPVREHSRKPDQMHEDLEKLFDGPYCELFGRQSRVGWDVWGAEASKFDASPAPVNAA